MHVLQQLQIVRNFMKYQIFFRSHGYCLVQILGLLAPRRGQTSENSLMTKFHKINKISCNRIPFPTYSCVTTPVIGTVFSKSTLIYHSSVLVKLENCLILAVFPPCKISGTLILHLFP
jgi:hypothetical protein